MADLDLTPRQMEVLCFMYKCLKDKPFSLVDMDKFTKLGGFENKGSAGAFLRKVLKKVMESGAGRKKDDAGAGDEDEAGEKAKATPKKRGRKANKDDDDDDAETPAKRKGTPAKKVKKGKAAAEGEDGDEATEVNDERVRRIDRSLSRSELLG
ncbi:hypothetical protein LTR95_002289 [Oleoguttula sp. CCFEE 5521]